MQTSVPNVYACGDITAFSLLAHTAVSEAEVAVDHILGKNRSMSYKAIPGVVYTNPEIAGVGKTEEELQAEGTPYTVKKIPMAFSGRFVAENEQGNGVCKLILAEDETIIGAHLLGNPASELIVIAGIAVEKRHEGLRAEVHRLPTSDRRRGSLRKRSDILFPHTCPIPIHPGDCSMDRDLVESPALINLKCGMFYLFP